jgi:pimeloyl-ACP methyl ester carboxylesterase
MHDLNRTIDRSVRISRTVADALQRRTTTASQRYAAAMRAAFAAFAAAAPRDKTPADLLRDGVEYRADFAQRAILFWDTLRQRGNQWIAHEAAGKPPVLDYDYEMIADARGYERAANYALVRIIPPKGVNIDDRKRPFVIVDPRAGHGPGIGGFKEDSEVGVALKAGHPVYFVIFFPDPEPGQTLADVTDAEAEFIRIVDERHPHAQKPVIIGNCQGGWAVMMLAAARPDIAGPLVINGAPMSYWAGGDGGSPMRYAGGLLGGAWPALFASDLGGGKFDGATLVDNFERLNPANSLWEKWYHLFANIDTEPHRFLEFERWWGGYYLMNEEEIRWIVNNLFVGNKLTAGEARLGPGRYFDLKSIKQPIIVFASMGDNITPPQQAFNWIADIYESTEEIKAHGQTIIGLLHEDVGHLGIFVSGQVAKKEHTQIVEVLNYIQTLPPGLYGMDIEEIVGRDGTVTYDVTLKERSLEDLRASRSYEHVDQKPFEAVAALSELLERAYSLLARPVVRAMVPDWFANATRDLHPLRVQQWAISDKNPWLWPLSYWAEFAKANRRPRAADNDGIRYEHLKSAMMTASLDYYRDLRDASFEAAFYEVYGNLFSLEMADERAEIKRKSKFDPRALPAVREVLDTIEHGSVLDGLARIAMLVAKAGHGTHRLSQMQRTRDILAPENEIAHLSEDERRRLLQEETIVVEFEPLRAKRSLPKVLRTAGERRRAHRFLDEVASHAHLETRQRALVGEIRAMLPVTSPERDADAKPRARRAAKPSARKTSREAPAKVPRKTSRKVSRKTPGQQARRTRSAA